MTVRQEARGSSEPIPLLLCAASVGLLKRVDRLIVERDRRAPMALLADEVEAGRRLMTAQARLVLGEIDDAVAAVADLRAGRRDVQRKELPAVGFWELLTRMLHHGFERNQLEDGADGILHVRDAIPEDAQCLRQLLGIRVLDARVPDLGPVEDAPKGLLGHGDVSRGCDRYRPEGNPNDEHAPLEHMRSPFQEVATLVRRRRHLSSAASAASAT